MLSKKLFKRAKTLIPGGVNSPVRAFKNVDGDPFFVRRAKGARIEDVDGNHYIDYVGTWGPAILGHAPNSVTGAIHEMAKDGVSFGIPHPGEVEMAQTIVDWVPAVEKVRLVSSGTEATMSCIRLARGFTKRDKIVKFEGCYHGHVDSLLVAAGSGALTFGEPDSAGVPASLAAETITLPYNDPVALEECFQSYGDQIAALIVESYPANAGLILPKEGFLQQMRDITTQHGSLLIFDEVMTGFRLAKGGVAELEGIRPDLTAMGKVIGGGLPVGAFGGRGDIMEHLAPNGSVYQAGTLSGNPLAVIAGLTQLRELDHNNGFMKLEALGARFEEGIRKILHEKSLGYTFHRKGSMFCLFFTEQAVNSLDDVETSNKKHFRRYFWNCLNKGLYMAPSPYETGFISMAHTFDDIDRTLEIINDSI